MLLIKTPHYARATIDNQGQVRECRFDVYDPTHMVTDPSPAEIQIVLITAPPDAATALARALVDERLAACVNLVPGLRSVYRWRGEVLDEPETLLIVKTGRARVPALMQRVPELHPHDVPEILALSPETGLPGYLGWVLESTAPSPSSEA